MFSDEVFNIQNHIIPYEDDIKILYNLGIEFMHCDSKNCYKRFFLPEDVISVNTKNGIILTNKNEVILGKIEYVNNSLRIKTYPKYTIYDATGKEEGVFLRGDDEYLCFGEVGKKPIYLVKYGEVQGYTFKTYDEALEEMMGIVVLNYPNYLDPRAYIDNDDQNDITLQKQK